MTVWVFYYNSCIYESAAAAISMHMSGRNALKAMIAHKTELEREFREMNGRIGKKSFYWSRKWDEGQSWFITKREILP